MANHLKPPFLDSMVGSAPGDTMVLKLERGNATNGDIRDPIEIAQSELAIPTLGEWGLLGLHWAVGRLRGAAAAAQEIGRGDRDREKPPVLVVRAGGFCFLDVDGV